jgi:hypothetical protein
MWAKSCFFDNIFRTDKAWSLHNQCFISLSSHAALLSLIRSFGSLLLYSQLISNAYLFKTPTCNPFQTKHSILELKKKAKGCFHTSLLWVFGQNNQQLRWITVPAAVVQILAQRLSWARLPNSSKIQVMFWVGILPEIYSFPKGWWYHNCHRSSKPTENHWYPSGNSRSSQWCGDISDAAIHHMMYCRTPGPPVFPHFGNIESLSPKTFLIRAEDEDALGNLYLWLNIG